jgi:hypothetical protein
VSAITTICRSTTTAPGHNAVCMSELSGDGGTVGPGQSTSGQVPAAHGTAPSPATLRKPVSRAQTLRAQRTVSYIAAVSDEADDNEGRAAAAAHMRSHRDAQRPDDGTSANCIFTAPTLSDPTALGRGTRGRFTCRLVTHNVFGLPAVNCAFHEAPHTVARGAKIGTVLACIRCDNPQSVYAHSCASAEPLAHVHVSTHMARTLHTMLWPVCHSLSLTHLDKYSPPPPHTHTHHSTCRRSYVHRVRGTRSVVICRLRAVLRCSRPVDVVCGPHVRPGMGACSSHAQSLWKLFVVRTERSPPTRDQERRWRRRACSVWTASLRRVPQPRASSRYVRPWRSVPRRIVLT